MTTAELVEVSKGKEKGEAPYQNEEKYPSTNKKIKKVISIKKVFISQPMRGKTSEEIVAERKKVMEQFPDYEEIDSLFVDAPNHAAPLWFLGESIKMLGDADVVYFCKDWEQYNGCNVEHECAVRYGKEILYA